MRISRETDYAIRCMLHLCGNSKKVAMVDEIAKARDVPKSFLAKILQKLKRAKLVESFRGVKGGFKLAKDPARISLLDVIEAIQGGVGVNICTVDDQACDRSAECVVHPVWKKMRSAIEASLREHDLRTLAEAEKGKSV